MENENKEQKPKSNILRTSILFLLLLVAIIIIFWVVASQPRGEEITYDYFKSELEAGHVERVELNSKQISIKMKDGTWCWLYNRTSVENSMLEDCKAYNERVEEADPSLQLTSVKIVAGTTTTINILNILYPIFLLAVLGILVFMVMRQIRGINSKSMEFTKNRARISASKVKFDKVAGADEEKAELEEIIQFLKDPEKFTKIGARIPKGVLLVGPPGTGKTLLAKAVAGEANVPFFTISGSDFMELYVGVGASRVRDLFENAKKAKPCIVFIDEIDAVGRQRGTGLGGGNDEREQTLNQLLVQMDGFETNEGIIVMAATNRADILDPALTRPGRFDRQIYISSPDVKGREEILRVHAEGKPLAKDVKLKEIARVTSGFTGADLENLLNEAAILAARQNHTKISMEDINNAIVKVTMGPQKRSRVVTEKDKRITAYHEAGHAVVEKCVKTSNPVHEVSIIQRGGAAGYTISRPDNDESHMTRQKLIDYITMALGGRSAEELFLDDITTGASNDINQATNVARRMVTEWGMSSEVGLVHYGGEGSELFLGRDYQTRASYSEKEASVIDNEVKKIISKCYEEAKSILTSHKKQIETMVAVLLEKETIYSDEVDMIMNGATSEEVINFIEEKAKTKKEELAKKAEEEKQSESTSAGDYVDALIKQAEERAKQKFKENAKPNVEEKENVARETSSKPEEKAEEEKTSSASLKENTIVAKNEETKPQNIKKKSGSEKSKSSKAVDKGVEASSKKVEAGVKTTKKNEKKDSKTENKGNK